MKRHNWNDLEIVANCKDTPIRRCGGNQRGNWRNECRPCVGMTGPTRAGDKSTTPRYGVTLLRGGTGFAGEHGLVEKELPAVRRITVRWKLDLILLNPPNPFDPQRNLRFAGIRRTGFTNFVPLIEPYLLSAA